MKNLKLFMTLASILILGNAQAQVKPENEKQKKNLFQIGTTSISFLDGTGLRNTVIYKNEFRRFAKIPYLAYERSFANGKLLVSASIYSFWQLYLGEDNVDDNWSVQDREVKNLSVGIASSIKLSKKVILKPGITANQRKGHERFSLSGPFYNERPEHPFNSFGVGSKVEIEYQFYKSFVFSGHFELCHYMEKKRDFLGGYEVDNVWYQPNRNQFVCHLTLGYKI